MNTIPKSTTESEKPYSNQYGQKLKAKTELYRKLNRSLIYIDLLAQKLIAGDAVLDIATGLSDVPLLLYQKGFKVFAIDHNEDFNKEHRNFIVPDITFINGDIFDMSFKTNQFKGIIAKDILEHIPDEKLAPLLQRISTLLQQEGLLVVGCPVKTFSSRILRLHNKIKYKNFEGIDDTGDTTHLHWFTEKSLRQKLSSLKEFSIMDVKYVMYGINHFPRVFILPLWYLQKILHSKYISRLWASKIIQKLFGFRIVIVLKKTKL